jgi:hypothetical protein
MGTVAGLGPPLASEESAARFGHPMQSKATTVRQYLTELPPEKRAVVQAVREVVLASLDPLYEEGMQYGMIGYYVPHRVYPPGYQCDPKQPLPFVCLASQKNYFSLYLGCVYGTRDGEAWFQKEWAKSGKKLDMGKSCLRFQKLEDLALDVVAEAVRRVPTLEYIRQYEALRVAPREQSGRKAVRKTVKKTKTASKRKRVSATL